MQNLKYLDKIHDEETRFGVSLNEHAVKHEPHIQLKMALSLLEFFNDGKFILKIDIEKIGDVFYVSKEKYFKPKSVPKSKVFAIRVNLTDSEDEINKKIVELQEKVKNFRNLNQI